MHPVHDEAIIVGMNMIFDTGTQRPRMLQVSMIGLYRDISQNALQRPTDEASLSAFRR